MPAINAVVQAISIKEMPAPDKFDNTHRAAIKIDEVFWGNTPKVNEYYIFDIKT